MNAEWKFSSHFQYMEYQESQTNKVSKEYFLSQKLKTAVQGAELLNHSQTEERNIAKGPLLGSLYEKQIMSKIKQNSENIAYH